MTPEEFLDRMNKISDGRDTELGHIEADELLCEVLTDLGYGEGVKVFLSMDKWYA